MPERHSVPMEKNVFGADQAYLKICAASLRWFGAGTKMALVSTPNRHRFLMRHHAGTNLKSTPNQHRHQIKFMPIWYRLQIYTNFFDAAPRRHETKNNAEITPASNEIDADVVPTPNRHHTVTKHNLMPNLCLALN